MKRLKMLALIGMAAKFDGEARGWALEAEYREHEGGNPQSAFKEMARYQKRADRCRQLARQLDQQPAPAGAPF